MNASIKLRQLEFKLSTLQIHQQNLLKERQQEIAALITSLDLASFDDSILLGGLLFLKDKIIMQNPMVEVWQQTGMRFLRRKQKQNSTSKRVTTSYQTPQLVTKQPQSRKAQDAKTTELTS